MQPSGGSSGAKSKAEAAKTAGALFPVTPALSPRLIIAHILIILCLYINMLCILWWDA